MPSYKDAMVFVRAGIAVLPVFMPDEKGVCTCSLGKRCKSPGKHPRADLAPHGVHDATLDKEKVKEYFAEEANIGIACGKISGGLMVFDVDDTKTAQKLLKKPDLLIETAVSATRRGCHVYMRTDGDTRTVHLRDDGGLKLGELRGDGAYVVAPPSRRVDGDTYHWVNDMNKLADAIETLDKPAMDFTIALLTSVGVDVAAQAAKSVTEFYIPNVEPIGLPWKPSKDENKLRQLLTGTMPTLDRSGTLMQLTIEILKSSERHNYNLSAKELAGVVKKVDAIQWRKYSDRGDDKEYGKLAYRVIRNSHIYQHQVEAIKDEDDEEGDDEDSLPAYIWIDDKGLYKMGKKDKRIICNFRPDLMQESLIYLDDDEVTRKFLVRFERFDGSFEELEFTADEVADTKLFIRKVMAVGGSDFHIEPGMAAYIWHAAQSMTNVNGLPVKVENPSHTGWINREGRDVFVLPNDGHGIFVSQSPDVEYTEFITPQALMNYGRHVRPAWTDADKVDASAAFRAVLGAAVPEVSIPIMLHILAGPVVSQGVPEAPCLVHIAGLTGTFKTTYATAALSMFGQFDRGTIPGAWNWTHNALGRLMHDACDLTVLVDDFKASRLKGTRKNDVMEFIHSYSDRSPRGRMNPRQQQQHLLKPRALMLSTGEDTPDWEQSMLARMIVVDLQRGSIDAAKLTTLQELVDYGALGLIGGTWLSWLATKGIDNARSEVDAYRVRARERLSESTHHPRMSDNFASLFAVGGLVSEFLTDRLPDCRPEFMAAYKVAWKFYIKDLVDASKNALDESPFHVVMNNLKNLLASKEVRMDKIKVRNSGQVPATTARLTNAEGLGGGMLARATVGFWDGTHMYLSRELTFNWLAERLRRGNDEVSFSWNQFIKESINSHGGWRLRVSGDLKNGHFLRIAVSDAFWAEGK